MKGAPDVSPLEAHLGYWLRSVSNYVSHSFKQKVESQGVTVAEWVVLRALFEREGVRPSELSEVLGLTRGAISKLVERLSDKELVVCSADREDRRSQFVRLATAGRKLVPRLARLADENDAEVFGHLSERQRVALLDVLQDIVRRHELQAAPVD